MFKLLLFILTVCLRIGEHLDKCVLIELSVIRYALHVRSGLVGRVRTEHTDV